MLSKSAQMEDIEKLIDSVVDSLNKEDMLGVVELVNSYRFDVESDKKNDCETTWKTTCACIYLGQMVQRH
mgnify:CR=1 FL=1